MFCLCRPGELDTMLQSDSTMYRSWAAEENVLSVNVTPMRSFTLPKADQLEVVSDHYTTLHSSML